MTRAGESVGKAVGTGIRTVRRGAVRAGHVGADAAATLAGRAGERLAERGVTADHLRSVVVDRAGALVERAEEVEKSTRKSRKQLAKRAKGVRKDLAKAAERARKEARTRAKDVRKAAKQARKELAVAQQPRSRRWPWVVAILVAGAAAGYVALTRRPQEVHLEEEDVVESTTPAGTGTTDTASTTGAGTTGSSTTGSSTTGSSTTGSSTAGTSTTRTASTGTNPTSTRSSTESEAHATRNGRVSDRS